MEKVLKKSGKFVSLEMWEPWYIIKITYFIIEITLNVMSNMNYRINYVHAYMPHLSTLMFYLPTVTGSGTLKKGIHRATCLSAAPWIQHICM